MSEDRDLGVVIKSSTMGILATKPLELYYDGVRLPYANMQINSNPSEPPTAVVTFLIKRIERGTHE